MKMRNGMSRTVLVPPPGFKHCLLSRYFNRDVECIRTFFRRKYQYESVLYPKFSRTLKEGPSGKEFRLDVVVAASGFGNKEMKTLEQVS